MAKEKAAETGANESKELVSTPAETGASVSKFLVSTPGYKEGFSSYASAKKQYDTIKNRSVKNKETIKITLIEVDINGKKTTLDNVSISEDFFE